MANSSLLRRRKEYAKYYGNLRGVDFSSEHTSVLDTRLAYLCNMWKDYHNGQGNGIETIPGYRMVMKLLNNAKIYGIHEFVYIENGVEKRNVLIHAGTSIYVWNDFPTTHAVSEVRTFVLGEPDWVYDQSRTFYVTVNNCQLVEEYSYIGKTGVNAGVWQTNTSPSASVSAVTHADGSVSYTSLLSVYSSELEEGDVLYIKAMEKTGLVAARSGMAEHESKSFAMNGKLYILDGTNFLVYDGATFTDIVEGAYVPTAYINGIPGGANKSIGTEYEQRNMLSPLFKQTYIADGTSKEFEICVPDLEAVTSIKVYGKEYMNTRLQSVNTIVGCIRDSFSAYASGDINGTFRVEKNTADDRWKLQALTDQGWLTGEHYEGTELKSDYDPEDLDLEVEEPSAYAKPGFVSVDIDGWDASPLGGENGEFVFSFSGNAMWKLVGEQTERMLTLDYGVSYDYELETTWFSTSDTDPKHNLLTIVRESGSDIVEFDIVTKNGTQQIVCQTDSDKVTFNRDTGIVTFVSPPSAPEDTEMDAEPNDTTIRYYPEGYAGVEITASKTVTQVKGIVDEEADVTNLIKGCTLVATFDGRVFLSGNKKYPTTIFWCGRNVQTGMIDPSYWGLLNYVSDGVETVPVKAMLPVADTLMVLKGDTRQDGSIFYHVAKETGENLLPVTYPSQQGLAGTGCLGAVLNFKDDPVFVSKYGLEAIGQLSVRLERAMEHRSTLVDTKLIEEKLDKAQLFVWDGYLGLAIEGKVYLADSRQAYANKQGIMEYEWYYLEGIGVYDGQYDEYRYADRLQYAEHTQSTSMQNVQWCKTCGKDHTECTCQSQTGWVTLPLEDATEVYDPATGFTSDLSGQTANGDPSVSVLTTPMEVFNIYGISKWMPVNYVVREVYNGTTSEDETPTLNKYSAYLVLPSGAKIGGTYHAPTKYIVIDNKLLFGTDNGKLCLFNTDKRNSDGGIDSKWYTFDGRTIVCGCATKMDNCEIPHLTKTTIRKSVVIKTKGFDRSAAKVKVRTNGNAFNQAARINSTSMDFSKMDFEDFTLGTTDKDLFAIRETERHWVEKQYYLYSDEFRKPFALYYLAYRYIVLGRYKNR